ncbi:MAG: response regulator [Sphingomonas adhaesiva]|uniref:response regulator n=1 Tax=Sphingomonas adhaesiva TaxID=28212 RepID=UPI002FFA8791
MCHVLVIDDEPLTAEYVADIAEAEGATSVLAAASEAEALNAARCLVPDVIISDVDLKAGGTGPHACAAILAKPVMQDEVIKAFQQVAPR